MKKKLFIFSNESISVEDNKYYCDNLDLKSTPEGLNKKFEVNLLGRKSHKKRSHEIKINIILNAVDEKVKTVQCKKESKKGCNGKTSKCITHNLWDELEVHINNFFEQKSLKDLSNNIKENRI